jgi:hypothetical protein
MQRVLVSLLSFLPWVAAADEGGVSYWLPGNFSSFAATPGEPGWSFPVILYGMSADAGGEKAFTRGGRVTVGLNATGDLLFLLPTYTFERPVAGGQAAVSLAAAYGRIEGVVDATLTSPNGGVVSGHERDSQTGLAGCTRPRR